MSRDCHSRGKPQSNVTGEGGPRQHGDRPVWQDFRQDLGQKLAGFELNSLGAKDDRRAGINRFARGVRHRADVLCRRSEQNRAAGSGVAKVRNPPNIFGQADARKELRVFSQAVDGGDHLWLPCPQQDLPHICSGNHRQRRTPGPGTHHCNGIVCLTGKGRM